MQNQQPGSMTALVSKFPNKEPTSPPHQPVPSITHPHSPSRSLPFPNRFLPCSNRSLSFPEIVSPTQGPEPVLSIPIPNPDGLSFGPKNILPQGFRIDQRIAQSKATHPINIVAIILFCRCMSFFDERNNKKKVTYTKHVCWPPCWPPVAQ